MRGVDKKTDLKERCRAYREERAVAQDSNQGKTKAVDGGKHEGSSDDPEGPAVGDTKSARGDPTVYQVGDLVTWMHVPRGGYGYPYAVDGVVIKMGATRITIRVQKKDGTEKEVAVHPEHLRPRARDRDFL